MRPSTRFLLPLAAGAVLVYLLASAPAQRPAAAAARTAAPLFVLPDLQGKPVALDSFRGRPALLNFWATWCPPCRAELPALQSLADGREDCLAVVGVALNSGGAQEVQAFVRERGLRYPMLLGNDQLAADYEVRTIPKSVLLDAAGNEAAQWEGPIDPEVVRAAVHALGAAPPRC